MGGFCPGGFCPGGFCLRGDFVQGDFVLEPLQVPVFQIIFLLNRERYYHEFSTDAESPS